eukprot:703365-Rhodomonas_salina.1
MGVVATGLRPLTCCAMSGTDREAIVLRGRYAMSGTELEYAATRWWVESVRGKLAGVLPTGCPVLT